MVGCMSYVGMMDLRWAIYGVPDVGKGNELCHY